MEQGYLVLATLLIGLIFMVAALYVRAHPKRTSKDPVVNLIPLTRYRNGPRPLANTQEERALDLACERLAPRGCPHEEAYTCNIRPNDPIEVCESCWKRKLLDNANVTTPTLMGEYQKKINAMSKEEKIDLLVEMGIAEQIDGQVQLTTNYK